MCNITIFYERIAKLMQGKGGSWEEGKGERVRMGKEKENGMYGRKKIEL